MVNNNLKKEHRMRELEYIAIGRYINKVDFDYTEYMTEDELNEYAKLYKDINGRCMMCGEIAKECICEKGLCNNY